MQEGRNDEKTGRELRKRWRRAALAYFHRDEDMTAEESGMIVRVGGNSYWIPHPGSGKGYPMP